MRRTRPAAVPGACVVAVLLAACTTAQDVGQAPHPTGPASGNTSVSPAPTPSVSATPPQSTAPDSGSRTQPGFGPGPAGPGLDRFYHQRVVWRPCGGSDTCASVWVPLDYAHPDRQAITIKAKMQPAGDRAAANRTIFINPGGPGGSGIDYLSFVGFGPNVTSQANVVGFDPRGVGQSTPVDCVSDHRLDAYLALDPSPDTPAEVATMEREWGAFTSGCLQRSGRLLPHLSTIEAARDMDILRAVVKDPTLNFYGASYGSYLGATYAALFPHRVGRMVLDGIVDPAASPLRLQTEQTIGFQNALIDYLTSCVGSANCPLGSTVQVAQRQIVRLFERLDAHPLPTSSGRQLTEGLAFLGFVLPLYSQSTWPLETQALEQALEGNGDSLLYLSDQYSDRSPSGHYLSNAIEVQSAVLCLDHPQHETVAQIEQGSSKFRGLSPVFGPIATWFPYTCSNWPIKPTLPKPDYTAPGAPPILVVGTTRDPATPYDMAVSLAKELGSGVLLTRVGDGHTAYDSGNLCIRSAVDTFLASGRPPAEGTRC
jgi:pimeloyl-ACP methyl ester carboxylesterase